MQQRTFGQLGDISALPLGGGGIGQVWGPTTREEAIATVREAWASGITFFDVAPSYGRGEAELGNSQELRYQRFAFCCTLAEFWFWHACRSLWEGMMHDLSEQQMATIKDAAQKLTGAKRR